MARIRVEVAYALAEVQDIARLEMEPGSNAGDAVAASGLLERYALVAGDSQFGLAGRRIPPGQELRDGDRVELLRPLALDPREARRARARRNRHR